MILKIIIGKGARGLLDYVSQLSKSSHHPQLTQKRGEPKQHTSPTFSNFAGNTPRQISAEFSALRLLKPNLNKAVGHLILSPSATDRALTKEEWQTALQLALRGHGAGGALHAAYLHSDTDLEHLHVFFSRILPSGQVISDSQSYQKNRATAREIERELNMETINSTPAPDAPGNRQAAFNAAHREDRMGLKALDQAEIRAALAESKNLAELEAKLQALGIEVEFSRRGQRQEIFGWKLRRAGDDQWQKASTLAKDLSWPSIQHRFTDAPAPTPKPAADDFIRAEPARPADTARPQPQQQHLPAKPKRRTAEEDDEAEEGTSLLGPAPPAPMSLAARQRRAEQYKQRQQAIQTRVDSSNFAKALGQFGLAISHFTLELIARFIEWLKSLLASKFGIGIQGQVTPALGGRQRVALQLDDITIEAEARLIEEQPQPLTLDYKLDQAAEVIEEITSAVLDQHFAHMPGVASQGGAELVAELQKTIKPDPAVEFSGTVATQIKTFVAALASHQKAEAEFRELVTEHDNYKLGADLEQAKIDARQLKNLDYAWSREHWAQFRIGVRSGHHLPMKAAAEKLAKLELQFEAEKPGRSAKWKPLMAAAELRSADAKIWIKSASGDLQKATEKISAFYEDPRFSVIAASLPKHVQIVTSAAAARLTSSQRIDVQTPVAALIKTLAEWDEAAKTPLPRPHKPLLKDEQKDKPEQRPDDGGFEVPR